MWSELAVISLVYKTVAVGCYFQETNKYECTLTCCTFVNIRDQTHIEIYMKRDNIYECSNPQKLHASKNQKRRFTLQTKRKNFQLSTVWVCNSRFRRVTQNNGFFGIEPRNSVWKCEILLEKHCNTHYLCRIRIWSPIWQGYPQPRIVLLCPNHGSCIAAIYRGLTETNFELAIEFWTNKGILWFRTRFHRERG